MVVDVQCERLLILRVKGYSNGMRKAGDIVYGWLGFLYVAS